MGAGGEGVEGPKANLGPEKVLGYTRIIITVALGNRKGSISGYENRYPD